MRSGPLPDFLRPGLRIVFVGINPGRHSAARGHHYAGPANHFWPLLYESGLVPEPVTYEDDHRLPEWGIGLTNLVARSTPGSDDLTREELAAAVPALKRKLRRVRPRIVCLNGQIVAAAVFGRPSRPGLQDEKLEGIPCYVMPSTSPRVAAYSRERKLQFFRELKDLVDGHRGQSHRGSRNR